MKKKLAMFLGVVLGVMMIAGCGSNSAGSSGSSTESSGESAETAETGNEEAVRLYDIQFISKGLDSTYYQVVQAGVEAAAEEVKDVVKITCQGPSDSTATDEQVNMLENVLAGNPDAIIIAAGTADSVVATTDEAYDNGVIIALVDEAINSDKYHTKIATDNYEAGERAAEAMVEGIQAAGKELKGSVGIQNVVTGVASLEAREGGFRAKMAEIAPDITLLPTVYDSGDSAQALSDTLDIYSGNSDLLGIYACADNPAIGLARAIEESDLSGKFVAIAADSDDEEISALTKGNFYALIVQDPYSMGYQAVMNCVEILQGNSVDKDFTTPVAVITTDNMDTEENHKLLYPNE